MNKLTKMFGLSKSTLHMLLISLLLVIVALIVRKCFKKTREGVTNSKKGNKKKETKETIEKILDDIGGDEGDEDDEDDEALDIENIEDEELELDSDMETANEELDLKDIEDLEDIEDMDEIEDDEENIEEDELDMVEPYSNPIKGMSGSCLKQENSYLRNALKRCRNNKKHGRRQ